MPAKRGKKRIQHKMMLEDLLEKNNVEIVTGKKLIEITDDGIIIAATQNPEETDLIQTDSVIMCIGLRPNKSLAPYYYGKNIAVYEIGSAQQAGDIYASVHQAFEVVYHFD